MESWIEGVTGAILNRSVEELFGALLLALVLSAVGGFLGAWACRSRKDEASRLTAVIMIVTLAAMILAGGYVERQYDPRKQMLASPSPSGRFGPSPGPFAFPPDYFRMVGVLDADGDGRISREEYRRAAELLGTDDRPDSGPPRFGIDPPGPPDFRTESGPAPGAWPSIPSPMD